MSAATDLAARLRLHRSRDDWRGRCPACGYLDSFTLSVGKGGRLLGWCASCQDKSAITQLLSEADGGGGAAAPLYDERRHDAAAAARKAIRLERALSLWHGSEPVPGTLAERYLVARGLPHLVASVSLRYRADTPHPSRCRLPALIALVQAVDGGPAGIHRTFLRCDGSGKADIEPQRATLGPVRGGAIRLDPIAGEVCVGEGIESAASAGLLLGLPAWSAVACGNLEHSLALPTSVRSVTIAADADPAGERAANAAWRRWTAEGRAVRINAPHPGRGDFNDIWMRRSAQGREAT